MNKQYTDKIFYLRFFFPVFIILLGMITYTVYKLYSKSVQSNIVGEQLTSNIKNIAYYDEILTMSARMAVLTNEKKWIDRYYLFAPQLDKTINQSIDSVPTINAYLKKVDNVNKALIAMETKSFDLLESDQLDQARELIFSENYLKNKKIYLAGIALVTKELKKRQIAIKNDLNREFLTAIFVIVFLLLLSLYFTALMFRYLKSYSEKLYDAKEVAENAAEVKSEFLANMSHEIRTPMNSVIGMTSLALQGTLHEKQRNYVQKANIAAENLLGIINDILDFSKMEAGKLELSPSHFALKDIIKHTLHLVSIAAKDKDLATRIKLDKNVPKYYFEDALRLGQVLTNLTSNAVKFSDKKGTVTLKISLKMETEKDSIVEFTIIDEGIGISEENQAKLFKSFSQADSSTHKKFGGTGLGLAISKSIVGLMGGDIWVKSKEGEGSSFHFTVRLQKSNEENIIKASTDSKQAMELSVEKLQNKHILLVEDNEMNQELAIDLLERNGLKVTLAENGQEALNKLQANIFDIVLIDIQMPVMDGYQATQKIREDNKYKELAILAMTANATTEDILKSKEAGMNDHISKPIKPSEMFIQMAKWV